jgi:exopolysaccharide biosynthesis polyprenyl glycosylphosphotransferase
MTTLVGHPSPSDEHPTDLGARTLEILEHRRGAGVRRRGWLVRRLLLVADVLGIAAAMVLAELIVSHAHDVGVLESKWEIVALLASLPAWIVIAKLYGLYDRDEERADHSTADEFSAVFHMVTVCTFLFWVWSRLTNIVYPEPSKLILFWATTIAFIVSVRAIVRAYARRTLSYQQNTLIVGAGDVGQLIARKLRQHPEYGINLIGFIDAEPKPLRGDLSDLPVLGGPLRLPWFVRSLGVDRVIVAFSNEPYDKTIELVRSLDEAGVQVDVVPRLFELLSPGMDFHSVEGLPLIGLSPVKISRSSLALKRVVDIVGALFGLIVTAPLFVLAAWRIKRESPGPVFFRQERLGKDMREFTLLKFRTMRVDTDDAPHREYIKQTMSADAVVGSSGMYKLDRSDAVTPFGRWLRKTSLDELPQLINVLRGEMSLVGPRPCLAYETESFEPHHFERFLVPQGLTGLWQVKARARATFGEALDLDVTYARSWSLGLDLALLVKTPMQMFKGKVTA